MSLLDLWNPPSISTDNARVVMLTNMNAPIEEPRPRRRKPKPAADTAERRRQASTRFRQRHGEKLLVRRRIQARQKRIELLQAEIAVLERELARLEVA
jgi:hypothetical protein